MDAFLDHWGPRIVRWMGLTMMVACSALATVCLIGFFQNLNPAFLALVACNAFLVFIGWTLWQDEL